MLLLLKAPSEEKIPISNRFNIFKYLLFRFNHLFGLARERYISTVNRILSQKLRYFFCFLLIVVGLAFLFQRMPTAYLPNEDQGIIFAMVSMPTGATREQTSEVMEEIRALLPGG